MNQRSSWTRIVIILVVVFFMLLAINPYHFGKIDVPVVGTFWNWLQDQRIHLGLDLQGGTQLDYEIDLSEAKVRNSDSNADNDVDTDALIQGVKEVIEKRVNSLGVSEPNIFLSDIGDEKHIVVELPGVKDIEEAKAKVGKVVSLEFKTQKDQADQEEKEAIQSRAEDLLAYLTSMADVSDLEKGSADYVESGRVEVRKDDKVYKDEFPSEIQEVLGKLTPNTFYDKVVLATEGYMYVDGGLKPQEGYNILRLISTSQELRKRPVGAEDFETVGKEFDYTVMDEFKTASALDSSLRKTVDVMEKNEVTDVLEGADAFSMVKVKDLMDSTQDEWRVRASHILFKTEKQETLKATKPLKRVPETATEEEKAKLEMENNDIRKENEGIAKENEAITEKNNQVQSNNLEIKKTAEEVLKKALVDPDRFAELAKQYSEDGSAEQGGDLGYFGPGKMVAPFEEAVVKLDVGEIASAIVESEFGYHIIKLVDKPDPDQKLYQLASIRFPFTADMKASVRASADQVLKRVREEKAYTLERVWFSAFPDPWKDTDLDGRYFKRADVAYDQTTFRPYVSIAFDTTGAELFEKLTGENVGKPLAIFVGGELISAPRVNEKIAGGQAQITLGISDINQALKEANSLARDLNAGAIPAPLKKPNELNIGGTLGQDALQRSLRAGMLGLVILAVFIIGYYRLLGLLAVAALLIYGIVLTFFIQSEIPASLAYFIAGAGWFYLAYKMLSSRLDAWSKLLYLTLSVLGIFFVGSVMANPLVMTLAGIAGVILSFGMAVDANILIFSRIKEEFDLGRSFLSAVETGFDRAWSSILDSNVSTLITCGILFYFGSSIIRGFALNLALGIVISMFTAVVITKAFLMVFSGTKWEKINWLWRKKG